MFESSLPRTKALFLDLTTFFVTLATILGACSSCSCASPPGVVVGCFPGLGRLTCALSLPSFASAPNTQVSWVWRLPHVPNGVHGMPCKGGLQMGREWEFGTVPCPTPKTPPRHNLNRPLCVHASPRPALCPWQIPIPGPGTGILGLPVTLAHTGFWPFVVVFTVGLAMQVAAVILMWVPRSCLPLSRSLHPAAPWQAVAWLRRAVYVRAVVLLNREQDGDPSSWQGSAAQRERRWLPQQVTI